MGESDHRGYWFLGFTLAAVVVAAVAVLVLGIIVVAHRIRGHAARIDGLVRELVDATQAIWGLEQTHDAAVGLMNEAQSIAGHAEALADVLAPQAARR